MGSGGFLYFHGRGDAGWSGQRCVMLLIGSTVDCRWVLGAGELRRLGGWEARVERGIVVGEVSKHGCSGGYAGFCDCFCSDWRQLSCILEGMAKIDNTKSRANDGIGKGGLYLG